MFAHSKLPLPLPLLLLLLLLRQSSTKSKMRWHRFVYHQHHHFGDHLSFGSQTVDDDGSSNGSSSTYSSFIKISRGLHHCGRRRGRHRFLFLLKERPFFSHFFWLVCFVFFVRTESARQILPHCVRQYSLCVSLIQFVAEENDVCKIFFVCILFVESEREREKV